ncbi:MAG TPA: DUF1573 domain-containing protein [Anaerolineae bacterium]|nr:DUF1573 domain-containing protein [Ardenticatenia bacterium]HQZ70830.1 DUF1573 domain-containing protein [Anaerolineae bacterium]
MARQTTDMRRDTGGKDGDPEMVVSVDKRLVAALGVLVLVGLVGLGSYMAMRGGSQSPVADSGTGIGGPDVAATGTAQVAADMRAIGLDPDKAGGISQVVTVAAPPTLLAQGTPLPPGAGTAPAGAPAAVQTAAVEDPSSQEITRPEGAPDACMWAHDVLQNFPDPNVDNVQFSPERIETVKGVLSGPRLAIGDLNDLFSYDYGVVPGDEIAGHDFRLKNVGDADLYVSRIYTGCGCTATKIKDTVLDAAGFVKPVALKLVPGEETTFTVEYDPRVEASSPCRARHKFVQIFSNDATKTVFDPAQENQHETRFRIVIEPRYGYNKVQIATMEAAAEATKAAKKKDGNKSP